MGGDSSTASVGLLGPVTIVVDAIERPVTARRQRTILARLALDAGQPVSADRLLDDVWGENLPATGVKAVALHISKLRTALEPERSGDGALISTSAAGYRLDIDPSEVDIHRFDRLLDDARGQLSEAPEQALSSADAAIALWRGSPFGALGDEPFVDVETRRLEHQRLRLRRTRVEALLGLGRPHDVVVELETLVEEQPLEERLVELLMLAYHRSGRPADALRAYGDLRLRLGAELGIEPSNDLRRLESELLDGGPNEPTPPTRAPPTPSPAQRKQSTDANASAPIVPATEAVDLPSGMVTFLLSDVVGSTRLWEDHPNHMAASLELHDHLFATSIADAGGRLLKSKGEGDSTFNVFARASDAARAALDIQQALTNADWPGEVALTTRMAIHTGEAIERGGDYYGRTVNRVARLRGIASGGEILLTRAAADLVVDSLDGNARLDRLGLQQLRDLDRPETVFSLVASDPGDVDHTAVEPTDQDRAPLDSMPLPTRLRTTLTEQLVGRHDELGTLIEAWEDALDGTAGFCALRGDAGIGKTRLAAELASIAHDQGALVMMGRCDEFSTGAFEPIGEALRFVLERLDPTATAELVGDGGGALARLLPDLVPGRRSESGAADAERERLLVAIAAVFDALSQHAPVLLLIDDLHWADDATLRLLRHVLVHPQAGRLLIVVTSRPSELGTSILVDMSIDPHQLAFADHLLDLTGLGLDDTKELLRRAPIDSGTAEAVAREVHELTVGNPLFTLGVANSFDADHRHGNRVGLPDSVLTILDRQLDRLTADHLIFLQAAAILGPTFEVDIAAALAEVPFEVVEGALDAAERLRIVREESAGQLHLYSFVHGLLPTRLAARASSIRRRSLHSRAAQLVSSAPVDGDQVGRAARHAVEAGSLLASDVAIEIFRTAAQQATERVAVDEAVEWLELAMSRTDDAAETLDLSIELASAMQRANRYEWRRVIDDAFDRARAADDVERAIQAVIVGDRGTFSNLMAVDNARIDRLRWSLDNVSDDDIRSRSLMLAGLASELTFLRGDRERFTLIDTAVTLATEANEPELLLRVLEHRVNILSGPAHVDERLTDLDAMLRLLDGMETHGHRRLTLLGQLSQIHEMRGDSKPGRALLAEMEQLAATDRLLPRHLVQLDMVRAPWRLIGGDLDGSTASTRSAHARSNDAHARQWMDPMAGAVTARQVLAIRFWQQRSDTMTGAMGYLVEMIPGAAAHHAYWLLDAGRVDEAATVWAGFEDDWIPSGDALGAFTDSWALEAAAVCAQFDGRERCEFYYELLAPFADLLLNVYAPDQPTHHYLGLLARALDDPELARHHFESSKAFAQRLGAPLMEARAGLELAADLHASGDTAAALDLALAAEHTGRDLKAIWLTSSAGELIATLRQG